MPIEKPYTRQVTERFLIEYERICDRDLAWKEKKLKREEFVKNTGVTLANISRMKALVEHNITIEACLKMIEHYDTDPLWLFMGEDYEQKVNERIQTLDKMIGKLGRLIKTTERV